MGKKAFITFSVAHGVKICCVYCIYFLFSNYSVAVGVKTLNILCHFVPNYTNDSIVFYAFHLWYIIDFLLLVINML